MKAGGCDTGVTNYIKQAMIASGDNRLRRQLVIPNKKSIKNRNKITNKIDIIKNIIKKKKKKKKKKKNNKKKKKKKNNKNRLKKKTNKIDMIKIKKKYFC